MMQKGSVRGRFMKQRSRQGQALIILTAISAAVSCEAIDPVTLEEGPQWLSRLLSDWLRNPKLPRSQQDAFQFPQESILQTLAKGSQNRAGSTARRLPSPFPGVETLLPSNDHFLNIFRISTHDALSVGPYRPSLAWNIRERNYGF